MHFKPKLQLLLRLRVAIGNPKGFTLVEVLALVAIIIGGIAFLNFFFRGRHITKDQDIKSKIDALSLTLESNLKFRELRISCGQNNFSLGKFDVPLLNGKNLISKFIVIPINREVIDAVVNYKVALEGLSQSETAKMLSKSYKEFSGSGKTTFIIIISNNPTLDSSSDIVKFNKIHEDISLRIGNQEFYPIAYTTNFLSALNPGWNDGYVQFQDFRNAPRGEGLNAYSINFDGLHMGCGGTKAIQNWAFLFDESEVNFLSLIQKGLTKEEIRNRYIVNSFESIGLSQTDVTNLIKIVANTFSAYPGFKFLPRGGS
jgi:hypothetical protein